MATDPEQISSRAIRASQSDSADYKILQRLRQTCRVTLERYVDEASRHSGLLSRLAPGSLTYLDRSNLRILKLRADRAHEAYLNATGALQDYALEGAPLQKSMAARSM